MAAVTGPWDNSKKRNRRNRWDNSKKRRVAVWRWAVLLIAAVYSLLPLAAALKFTGFSAFGDVLGQDGFGPALWLSVRLAIVTTLITLALMVPTAVYVHLRLPRLRRALEGITILPILGLPGSPPSPAPRSR